MIHASVELVGAMMGVAPSRAPHSAESELRIACTGDIRRSGLKIMMACRDWPRDGLATEDMPGAVVTCPACRVLMNDACGKGRREALAVLADWLLEQSGAAIDATNARVDGDPLDAEGPGPSEQGADW